ncbi:putative nonribosomal peptide synthase [Aspergillus fischeri NRRL 181]|uniref:Nonribosomal peptide synthase, putative n=1 Tax=Neosartorya fischeri (strain ATCC 1020 / DSM 3700 / CBS 544.65 / FGSC A1164 / JCM 1740 / NRRL 181 / WB 181) TaxID=331117 RepID=A1DA53_NEOFI|nr:nonribosomal peptide synthase, putative [Aspergillus fischeri NRRL 181]EAW20684.1 nonribosomal peptide synthase, putative [Aspergillus fischeri NRRL 181]
MTLNGDDAYDITRSYEDESEYTDESDESDESEELLADLTLASNWDAKRATQWNTTEDPEIIDNCVHRLIELQTKARPDAPAVHAWDGHFTYAQLDSAANRLAHHLLDSFALQPDDLVHVCFEKSVWFFVSILAVNKAGAAWVPLDPSHPEQRQRQIVNQTRAQLALSSPANFAICSALVADVVEVTPELDMRLKQDGDLTSSVPVSRVSPHHAAYVLFTSGSTGTPKEFVMEHRSVCTSQTAISLRLQLTPEVRMLQFASFVFDLSIGEIIATLISGACLCVISEDTRMNGVVDFINNMNISWAFLTPAFARILKPSDVPNLELLLLAGEAVGRDVFDIWFGHVRLVNGWGPAETCCFSTLHEWDRESASESPSTIGRPVGSYCWLVDLNDAQRLVPIGTVGEVVIQGPTMLREYLANPEQTEMSTVRKLPEWAPRRTSPYWNRFYKSGDLCKYNANGTLEFISRKDTQVKIRGLRVELGEIEHHINSSLEEARQVAVDIYETPNGPSLAAYFCFKTAMKGPDAQGSDEAEGLFMPITDQLESRITAMVGELNIRLPRYMIPSLFIPCRYMPVITSTKIDRNKLRKLTSSLSQGDIAMYSLMDKKKQPPETPMELRLQEIWAELLKLPLDAIGRDDSFLRIGGDSISVIQLVSRARSEGLMALAARQPGSYIAKHIYRLPNHVNIDRFRAAWEQTMRVCANLRTRIILYDGSSLQVVVKDDISWENGADMQSALSATWDADMAYGLRLCRYAIAKDDGKHYFLWAIHHTINDGWTNRLVLDTLHQAYQHAEIPAMQPYSSFIQYVTDMNRDAASEFWRSQLQGAQRAIFPPEQRVSASRSAQKSKTHSFARSIAFPSAKDSSITKATILRAAWALVLARYCDTDDICFGTNVSGRHAPIPGVERMPGVVVATVPVRMRLDSRQTVSNFLLDVQNQASDMVPYEQFGLQNISKLSEDAHEYCNFSSLFAVQPINQMSGTGSSSDGILALAGSYEDRSKDAMDGYFNYPLIVQCHSYEEYFDLVFIYDSGVLDEPQLHAMCEHFDHVTQQLAAQDERKLGSVSLAGSWDREQVLQWHREEPKLVNACVHELVAEQASRTPDHEALFAVYLSQHGVRPESLVPICFEKSIWTVVAQLAVWKAGGAFLPLDPAHPKSRRQALVAESGARVMIVSPSQAIPCASMASTVLELSPSLILSQLSKSDRALQPSHRPSPSNAAYLIFTSGSTGKPKGVVVEHSAISSSIMYHGKAYHMSEESRVLQFANYTFDRNLSEIMTPLVYGGTVCVPSDTERLQDLPAFASLQAETISTDEVPTNIGRAFNNRCWIVDADNHQRLAPIGCMGELLVEGYALARDYLNDEERSKELFVGAPQWLPPASRAQQQRRFYKTGDLVKYNFDGSIDFLGRKDTQVKLRGQRIELSEIEYNIKLALPSVKHAVVDKLQRNSGEFLVAVVSFMDEQKAFGDGSPNSWLQPMTENARKSLAMVTEALEAALPAYMVPSFFVPVHEMPTVSSTKIDRKKIRQLASSLQPEQLDSFSLEQRERFPPSEEMEFRLRDLWATVLKMGAEAIGKHDSFLKIGGDSISAIQLVALAREHGIELSVTKIFESPRLDTMAANAMKPDSTATYEAEPFSLLPEGITAEQVKILARTACKLSESQTIEDAYPCTGLQEGLMALAVKQPGSHVARYLYRLPGHIDIERFRAAWIQTVAICSNLRTRIFLADGRSIQVVVKNDITWEDTNGLHPKLVLSSTEAGQMQYGSRLCRYALAKDENGETYFIWATHHAIFDGWTNRLVLDTLQRMYNGAEAPPLQPYKGFIKYVTALQNQSTSSYWKAQLQGAKPATFPAQGSRTYGSGRNLTEAIQLPRLTNSSITKATILRVAWAMVLARYCETDDVCFGTTISGRQAPVPGVDKMPGPVIATVPVRVRLDQRQTVSEFLLNTQNQASEMIAYEQYSLKNISTVSPDAKGTCDFSSLLVLQPLEKMSAANGSSSQGILISTDSEEEQDTAWVGNYFTYPLVVQAIMMDDRVDLNLTYDSSVLDKSQLIALCRQFGHVTEQLVSKSERTLSEISVAGPSDLNQALEWNQEVPEIINSTIHQLIEKQAILRPHAPAICAWDGNFSYEQLDSKANRLAHYLLSRFSIEADDLIHVCFEKSAWHFVSILAINKAGAAWIPLDPSHPEHHHRQIVQQTQAKLVLTSPTNALICAGLFRDVVQVTPEMDSELALDSTISGPPVSNASSGSAAYVLFTSGSTGVPKGLLMEHGAVCTSQTAISRRLRMGSDVRILQFAAFVFDLSIGEIIATLISGACLCVPSESTRMNSITDFIRDMNINWAFLTPAFVRTLQPSKVPSLDLLLLAGEAVGRDIFNTWFGKLRLINGWGPAETCCFSTLHEWTSPYESPLTVGRPVGGFCWIVDPNDSTQLAPTGCLGESFPVNQDDNANMFLPLTFDLQDQITDLIGTLNVKLPGYMIPTLFIPCCSIPFITSTKVDRRKLRTMAENLDHANMAMYALVNSKKRAPETIMEHRLQQLWAEILNLPTESIGRDDSFLRIGGDSISAISLVSMARDCGIRITVKDIFDDSRLSAVALSASEVAESGDDVSVKERFSLIPANMTLNDIMLAVQSQIGLDLPIEDAYPCTALQEGLMALAVKQPGSYVAKHTYRIPDHVDIAQFRAAWEQTMRICSNLRTRIVFVNGSWMQVVVRDDVTWEGTEGLDLQATISKMWEIEMKEASRLCQYALIEDDKKGAHFIWAVYHAVYDGWSMGLTLKTLGQVYRQTEISTLHPHSSFIRYTAALDSKAASEFWQEQLFRVQRANWPRDKRSSASSAALSKQATRLSGKTIQLPRSTNSCITKATVLRAAWALVLARYCDTDDICFGTTISGRQAPVPGVETILGPLVATVPVRIRLEQDRKVSSFLSDVQSQASHIIAYEQFGLQNIAKLSADAKDACDFSSLLVIQPAQVLTNATNGAETVLMPADLHELSSTHRMESYFSYPLVIQAHVSDNHVELLTIDNSDVITEPQVQALSHQFDHIVQQLLTGAQGTVGELSIAAEWDFQQATAFNTENPEIIDSTVHQLIGRQVEIRPNAPAIRAWDGVLTYHEFNAAANRLTHYLVNNYTIHTDELIHVCFEKSVWFFIAILAINKAGAAWVPLDPSHPEQRHQEVVQQTQARLALSSPSNANICARVGLQVLLVTPELDLSLKSQFPESSLSPPAQGAISPSNAAYVLFTSGSTGTPKGLVMEHRSVCTSQTAISQRLRLTPHVRMLQFASFVFDLCIGEIIAPLISGACLCVPSEHIRMNSLKEFIWDEKINWAFLTPSFVQQTLKPEDVPTLELLLLAGEPVRNNILDTWFGKVRLVNGWGPAETCCFSTLHEWQSITESPLTVGRPVGGFCWIVDPNDPSRLAPTGCIGEVMIQGPTILRGYLDSPKQTEQHIVTTLPTWAPHQSSPYWSRFYKSGDLCSYNADGTIEFSSRKDTQVKIRGLRVELNEIEHHTLSSLEGVRQVAVDTFNTENGLGLASYFCVDMSAEAVSSDAAGGSASNSVFLSLTTELETRIASMVSQLSVKLPRYMIPTLFIPCRRMPFITSTKLDRKELRRLTSMLTTDEIARFSLAESIKRKPETEMEVQLQQLCANILNISTDAIGRDDSFLRIGGDSISAIRLVSDAREVGIRLTVKDIFDDPRLSAMAIKASEAGTGRSEWDSATSTIAPFSLLDIPVRESVQSQSEGMPQVTGELKGSRTLRTTIRDECGLDKDQIIEDAYPCTKLQEGFMALAIKQPGSYIARYAYQLPDQVNLLRFKDAWEQTILASSNLRTRIVFVEGSAIQVVIKDDVHWDSAGNADLASVVDTMRDVKMASGCRLCRYSLATGKDGRHYFFLVVHHAIYDGWTVRLIMEMLHSAYYGLDIKPLRPYSVFMNYIKQLDNEAMSTYRKSQLQGVTAASFPQIDNSPSSTQGNIKSVTRSAKKIISFPELTGSSVTKATIFRAAWAVVLSSYCDTDDICFGTSISGRHAPVAGVERIAGPAVATVPVRIQLDRQQSIQEFLSKVQKQASDMVAYEHFGIQNISKLSKEAGEACNFSSLLVIQPIKQLVYSNDTTGLLLVSVNAEHFGADEMVDGYFNYPLIVQGHMYEDQMGLVMIYDSRYLSELQVTALSHQIDHVVQQLLKQDNKTLLAQVSVAGPWDLQQAFDRNQEEPEIVDACVHQLIEEQGRIRPDAPAVRAWDGNLTYRQLNCAANRLAHYLTASFGVVPDDLIHVCFEKSVWFFISILAINKAGPAWVPLDPSHPRQYHKQVIQQTKAKLALTSSLNADICVGLVPRVIQVTPELDTRLTHYGESGFSTNLNVESLNPPACGVSPRNAAYVLFTSGTTGTPKGLVMEHGSVCTSQTAINKRVGGSSESSDRRMLQFASYVFDACIGETISTLIAGGCLCVPSDETRINNITEFIREQDINWALLTPSFIRTVKPEQVPSLKVLMLAGEAVGRDILDTWFGKVRLINGWGPAETCVFSTIHEWQSIDESPLTVGRPVGGFCWIVDPRDPKQLTPIGAVGEVVIQGPTVLREYLANPEQTQQLKVLNLPEWAPRRLSPHWNCFYKSGDLASYNADGTIEFLSRKDTQIKIRGLRVELSEVEHHVRMSLEGVQQVAVDVFRRTGGENGISLVAYLCFNQTTWIANKDETETGSIFMPFTADMEERVVAMLGDLNIKLPRYMVPTLFVPCRYMPFITSTKLDRRKLRGLTESLSKEEIAVYSLVDTKKRPPETPMEYRLQGLWAETLGIAATEKIGRDDSFLRLGGDSITAITLVSKARDSGIRLTVKDIFDDPRLSAVAAAASEVGDSADAPVESEPFSLLPESVKFDDIELQIRQECNLLDNQIIADAYPCSGLQEGFMALAVKQPGSYIAKYIYRIPEYVDIGRFKDAWEQTVRLCSNLRTRILFLNGSAIQVVVKDDIYWDTTADTDLASALDNARNISMTIGSRLCQYSLGTAPDGSVYFIWTAHHAIYDGWTRRIIMETLHQLYHGSKVPALQPYVNFIQYVKSLDHQASSDYWATELQGATCASFPGYGPQQEASADSSVTRSVVRTIAFPPSTQSSVTKATILRAAWAVVLSRYCDSDDICFGTSISGRQAPVYGVERITGPAVATVPVRVRFDGQSTVSTFLQNMQSQASDMVKHKQFGLQNIIKLSPEAKEVCNFSSLLVIQPAQIVALANENDTDMILVNDNTAHFSSDEMVEGYFNYPLIVQGHVSANKVKLIIIYDSNVLPEGRVEALSQHFEHVVDQLLHQEDKCLAEVSVAGPWDLQQAMGWNHESPEIIDTCVHQFIERHAMLQPNASAICAWDGELTYSEFNAAANRLANHLVDNFALKSDELVHVCFEKSVWFFVSILAINKAGGAWVPLDPSHPEKRQQQVVEQTRARIALTSPTTMSICNNLVADVLVVTPDLDAQLSQITAFNKPLPFQLSPRNASYVLFTSGSTGTPKGLVMEHGSVCTSQRAIGKRLGISSDIRMLQFSSYVFDACIGEAIGTLIAGGCLCVPSEEIRMNSIREFIHDYNVSWALLTPSFIQTLKPEDVPSLEVLMLAGEAVSRDILNKWFGKVRLINGWGPAETCVFSTMHEWNSIDESPLTVGRPVGGLCWIVNPTNPRELAPIGCVGEVVIQGPTIMREYLANNDQTEESIVRDLELPDWAPRCKAFPWNRFYKSGDLASYNSDGTIEFSSRKDTQTKIRGFRVELSEIEHHIRASLDGVKQVAVDVLKREGGLSLVSYLCFNNTSRIASKIVRPRTLLNTLKLTTQAAWQPPLQRLSMQAGCIASRR